jgi:predicted transglutaminase-like cysteine proteinase
MMKNYLRVYVKYAQNDWMNHLSNVEFATNNHVNITTDMTSFFADHDYHSRPDCESSETFDFTTSKETELLRANKIIEKENAIRE